MVMNNALALSLFAGVGFGVACKSMGIEEVGVENDVDVNAIRRQAGMSTLWQDVWWGTHGKEQMLYELLLAGPPCQSFSSVGRGEGRRWLETIVELASHIAGGMSAKELRIQTAEMDERTPLVLLPLFYALRDMPRAIVLEQVPPVLPVWEAYAVHLRRRGYSVVTGIINAEAYGVPQTRRRAVLIAKRDGEARMPAPTHSRYHPRTPSKLDVDMPRWISMADAIEEWEGSVVGFPRRADGRDEGVVLNGVEYRARDMRSTDKPSWAITGKARSWGRWGFTERPATVVTGHGIATRHPTGVQRAHLKAIADGSFLLREPWTEETARLATYDNVSLSRSYAGDAVNITIPEGSILQTFPPDFPWLGSRTKIWQTMGNAVPPRLATHLIRAALESEV